VVLFVSGRGDVGPPSMGQQLDRALAQGAGYREVEAGGDKQNLEDHCHGRARRGQQEDSSDKGCDLQDDAARTLGRRD
jgi:hypothetical protein